MALDVAGLVGGALGGAVATSILGPIVAQRRERRDTRADVLRAISNLEIARWAPREWDDFRQGVSALWAAALVANAPRLLVAEYIQLAYVARRTSDTSWEEMPEEGYGGGIHPVLSDLARDAAEMVIDHVWHPYRRRPFVRSDMKRLTRKTTTAKEALRTDDERIDWTEWRSF